METDRTLGILVQGHRVKLTSGEHGPSSTCTRSPGLAVETIRFQWPYQLLALASNLGLLLTQTLDGKGEGSVVVPASNVVDSGLSSQILASVPVGSSLVLAPFWQLWEFEKWAEVWECTCALSLTPEFKNKRHLACHCQGTS